MALQPGIRLGAYEIVALLGAGGMGEVYRARDGRLGRDVALKMLPAAFASDQDRVARFRREAQVLASLNHAHIAAIHGLEETDGTPFLVLELVEGETLAERLRQGPLPLDEAVRIAGQIVDALAAAHDKGIVHRDLKPSNVALTLNDQAKVLDFGLAKAVETGASSDIWRSPTVTYHGTQAGVILGTAAYMSPEQAKGRAADQRSDIWAFGCLFYEMLSGKRAVEGDDVSDVLAAVLRGEPDWGALPVATPPEIRTLLRRCLMKDPQHRVGGMSVATYVLREWSDASKDHVRITAIGPQHSGWKLAIAAATGCALALAVVAGFAWRAKPIPSERPVIRFAIPVRTDIRLPSERHVAALSPDGTRLVYVAGGQLHLRALDELDAAPIRGTAENPAEPVFSPDGKWIVYHASGFLKRIPLAGGAPTTLSEAPAPWGAPFWEGERIVFSAGQYGILAVPASGGSPSVIVQANADEGEVFQGAQILSDGENILFTVAAAKAIVDRWASARVVVQSLRTGERRTLVHGATEARYLPTGHLVYARDDVLFAAPFDPARLELTGAATAVLDGVATSFGISTKSTQVAFSETGAMVYLPGGTGQTRTLAWRDRNGTDVEIGAPPRAYHTPRVSRDGTRIALWAADQENDIWVWDTRRQTLTRLTFEPSQEFSPVWTADGQRIVYVSSSGGAPNLWWRLADGTGTAEALFSRPPDSNGALVANNVTRDGKLLVYSIGVPANVMAVSLNESRQSRALTADPKLNERGGEVSPTGRWIAYQSNETGRWEIYVRPFPAVDGGRWQVSGDGGTVALWSPDGRELFYLDSRERLVSVAVDGGDAFSPGKKTIVFDMSDTLLTAYRNHDVAPDGSRFLILKPARPLEAAQFVYVQNWSEELKRRVSPR